MKGALFATSIACLALSCSGNACSLAAVVRGGEVVLTVYDYSPLREALEWVRAKYGWPVNYEDPIYREQDLLDVAAKEWRRDHPGERGYYVPRPTSFTVRFPEPGKGRQDEAKTLLSLVEQYNSSQTVVRAVLVQESGKRYTVFAEDAYRGAGGAAGSLIHITDVPGAGPTTESAKILQACSQQSPMPFVFGTLNPNLLTQAVQPRHERETCRHTLERLVDGVGPTAIYELRADPTDREMVLNIMGESERDASGDCPVGMVPQSPLKP